MGARVGVLRQVFEEVDANVGARMEAALKDLERAGAEIVDSVEIPLMREKGAGATWYTRFRTDLETYLSQQDGWAPVQNLEEILESGDYHPSIEERMQEALEQPAPEENPACLEVREKALKIREATLEAMDQREVDALIYPSWNYPPRLIGDLESPHGNNSSLLSPPTGFPAITVPMGFVEGDLPAGLQFLGRAWEEGTLIRLAYGYEQATGHRRVPDLDG